MKHLLFLLTLPAIANVNYMSGPESAAYADKATCDKETGADCFAFDPTLDRALLVQVIEDVEICEPSEEGVEPVCRIEKQKVVKIDESKKAAKEKADKDAKDADDARQAKCDDWRRLLADSAIDNKSKPEDVQEVTRRLLGYWKDCVQ